MSPTGKSYSFRSCVRASEAACACEAMSFPWLGFGSSQRAAVLRCCGVPRALPWPVLPDQSGSHVIRRSTCLQDESACQNVRDLFRISEIRLLISFFLTDWRQETLDHRFRWSRPPLDHRFRSSRPPLDHRCQSLLILATPC